MKFSSFYFELCRKGIRQAFACLFYRRFCYVNDLSDPSQAHPPLPPKGMISVPSFIQQTLSFLLCC